MITEASIHSRLRSSNIFTQMLIINYTNTSTVIWKLTYEPPKVVTISKDDETIKKIKANQNNAGTIYLAKAAYKVPTIIHVCHESRAIGLERYTRAFKEQLGGNAVYFDYNNDVLLFTSFNALRHFYGGTLMYISSAAFGFRYDMNEVHRNVQQVAIAHASNSCAQIIAWTLNLFTSLKFALIGSQSPMINRGFFLSRLEGRR